MFMKLKFQQILGLLIEAFHLRHSIPFRLIQTHHSQHRVSWSFRRIRGGKRNDPLCLLATERRFLNRSLSERQAKSVLLCTLRSSKPKSLRYDDQIEPFPLFFCGFTIGKISSP